jgi:hypothetical protein
MIKFVFQTWPVHPFPTQIWHQSNLLPIFDGPTKCIWWHNLKQLRRLSLKWLWGKNLTSAILHVCNLIDYLMSNIFSEMSKRLLWVSGVLLQSLVMRSLWCPVTKSCYEESLVSCYKVLLWGVVGVLLQSLVMRSLWCPVTKSCYEESLVSCYNVLLWGVSGVLLHNRTPATPHNKTL